jgi:hypothetical protein
MRFVLTLASLLTVTLLIFNGYTNDSGSNNSGLFEGERLDPVTRASNVNLIIEETAAIQRKALEKQIQ